MSIRAVNIVKRFARFAALDSVSLEVAPGRLTALLGPSGSGKTTLLRIIAGLEQPDSGEVFFEEEQVTRRPAKDRGAGFVFQHYALFNHMTVFENIAFGLRVRGRKDGEVRERVHALLDLIRLSGLEKRFPAQLSGGQRQRVALARALASEPNVLLLDEPFGALDAKVRRELRDWIRRLHEEIHMTSLFVTHDQEEAFEVADRVVILNHGRIEQEGSPQEIFDEPANAFVMEFLGDVNVFDGEVSRNKVKAGPFTVPVAWYDGYSPLPARLFVRPHEWDLSGAEADGGITAEVLHASPMGSRMKLGLKARPGGALINAEVDRAHYDRMAIAERSLVMVVPRKPRVFVQYGSL